MLVVGLVLGFLVASATFFTPLGKLRGCASCGLPDVLFDVETVLSQLLILMIGFHDSREACCLTALLSAEILYESVNNLHTC